MPGMSVEVVGKCAGLLYGYLRKLRTSTGIVGCGVQRDITDGHYIIAKPYGSVEFVDKYTSAVA